MAVGICLR